jgi:very-short-patch-repair endonuclease
VDPKYEKLFALEKGIADVFTIGIYEYNYNEWKDKLIAIAHGFLGMPFIKNDNPDFFIENHVALYRMFENIYEHLNRANAAFDSTDKLLGVNISANMINQQNIAEILTIIRKNDIIPSQWFEDDLSEHKILIVEAQRNATRLLEIKNRILAEWESEVLCLDYAPILLRFKTEYTSLFKIFKSQYKRDKKQLKGLSRTVIKKLSDDVATNLLLSLKDYHEQVEWFEANDAYLSNALSFYYGGIESKWNEALSAMDAAEKLKNIPTTYISDTLKTMLAKDHQEEIAALDEFLGTSATAFAEIQSIISSSTIELGVDEAEFNGKATINIMDAYLTQLALVDEQASLLSMYLVNGKAQFFSICRAIESLNEHKNLLEIFNSGAHTYKQHFGRFYMERQTNWDDIRSILHQTMDIVQLDLFELLKPIVNVDVSRKKEIKKLTDEVFTLYSHALTSFEWISAQFSADRFNHTMELTAVSSKLHNCLDAMQMLSGWIDYQEAKDDCYINGLDDFIHKIEDAEYHSGIDRIFLKGFYHMWLGAVCEKSAAVRRFRRSTHDEHIKKFIELDDLQLSIAQKRIREKLIGNLPSEHRLLRATDELTILNRELNKQRNIMPLRKLFKLIPNILMKLKPCLMMSPLSVSYFLETEAYHFDLVIFDEASQIFPEDAVGAIFRGSQVVIAGDSKQLPPTNFFSATTTNAESDYDINGEEDFSEVVSDSILEETATVLPNRILLWHYRSKHENLIAFSNREIYKNNLITFPNSITKVPDMGVEYIYVEDGYYEGGGKNRNIKEAEKCVTLVSDHIQRYPDRSLGIIAFSEKQQTAIENTMMDFRERNPKYEWFFDEEKEEPFFVKNLENVQGDERDTIIFSICYAKDKNGRMYMRFGPLGHEGGERRLNVAITRAKCNVKLVGSILPSDIDLDRTNSEGVRMLRSYIEFARQGTSTLKSIEKNEAFESKDDFCKVIVSFLKKHGYTVQTEVGCSDYKIDIAVVNPKVDGEYIAGIECDGLSYIHAKTARDRDHLRRSILQNMGWNLYRVWSTEWMRNSVAEGKSLLDFLHSVVDKDGKVNHTIKDSNDHAATASIEQIAMEAVKVVQNQKKSTRNPYGFAYYKEANWLDTPHSGSNDNLTRISENVKYIVSAEQPMHMELLYKRLGPSFTTGKATQKVKNTIDEAIAKRLNGKVRIDDDRFIRLLPQKPAVVRIPERNNTPRPMEYIHTEEVVAAMIRIIEHSYGIKIEDLSTECAHVFGFERKGPKIKQKTDAAINYLVDTGKVKLIDGKAQLVGSK